MASTLTRPLSFDSRGRLARASGRDALVARVATLIDTLPGEVEMEPELGSACRLRRHEPGDETLSADLREDVAEVESRRAPPINSARVPSAATSAPVGALRSEVSRRSACSASRR